MAVLVSAEVHSLTQAFLGKLRSQVKAEIAIDEATRLLAATDNSIYQVIPEAVIFPRCQNDVVEIFKLAGQSRYQTLKFSGRGGGTGTNGQSLTAGIIIDCSKYLNRILEVNIAEGFVRVEPGVVLDALNRQLQPHGVFFAPTTSAGSRATIGGMVNTDASGKGSCCYGKTSQHVLSLQAVLADGTDFTAESAAHYTGKLRAISSEIKKIVAIHKKEIAAQYPPQIRFLTGYDLAHVYDHAKDQLNLAALMSGSEGTLSLVTEIKLRLTPLPKFKKLLVLHYHTFAEALIHGQQLLQHHPSAIETMDATLVRLAQESARFNQVKAAFDFDNNLGAVNLVEVTATKAQTFNKTLDAFKQYLKDVPHSHYWSEDAQEINAIWDLRYRCVGILARQKGKRQPISGIEDTWVLPAHLPAYIKDFTALLDKHQLKYGMYGHVDAGCIHVRPALDMEDPDDVALLQTLTADVVNLLKKYQGVLWGEHGKGFRSQFVSDFFKPEIIEDLRKVKQLFDPFNQLNPGKIVTPIDSTESLVSIAEQIRAQREQGISADVKQAFQPLLRCNGNGACFTVKADDLMCPSYKATMDRRHSPKGRANLIREWLVQSAKIKQQSNSLLSQKDFKDFSVQVYDALAGCLGCQGCKTGCPVHINIPDFKAQFLSAYYQHHRRSLRDHVMARLAVLSQFGCRIPRLSNAILHNKLSRFLAKKYLNLVDLPKFSVPKFSTKKIAPAIDRIHENSKTLILIVDWLTLAYDAPVAMATIKVLGQLGFVVLPLTTLANGKQYHELGYLRQFTKMAKAERDALNACSGENITIVGLEPSLSLCYRHEYPRYGAELKMPVKLAQEWLVESLAEIPKPSIELKQEKHYYLFSHCIEQAQVPQTDRLWQQIFTHFGLELTVVKTGCCGMAGSYGCQSEHVGTSKKIFALSWAEQIKLLKPEQVLVTGFSCRAQVKRECGFWPKHPLQVLQGRS